MDAISLNPALDVYEKAILHELASQMDINGNYMDVRWMYIADLKRRTSISRSHIFRVLRRLEDRGYLVRQQRKADGANKNDASLYQLTPKIFFEFEQATNVRVLNTDPYLTATR